MDSGSREFCFEAVAVLAGLCGCVSVAGEGEVEEKAVDEREARLRRKLTPAGKVFLNRLDKALAEELEKLNNAGGDALRNEIARHHMKTADSVKSINRLAENGRQPRLTCCCMIMNYAAMLLEVKRRRRSSLNPLEEQLLQIWRIYSNRLVDMGEATQAQIDAEESALLQSIQKTGNSGSKSILDGIKSFFRK